MPDFAYTARNVKGDKVSGVIAAASERDALNLLATQSLFPLDVNAKKESPGFSFGGRVRGQLMAVTYGQMAALLQSGVPLLRSLRPERPPRKPISARTHASSPAPLTLVSSSPR